jgi:hypothetical protein
MRRNLLFLLVFGVALYACKGRDGSKCTVDSEAGSACAEGLVCVSSGRMTRKGDTFSYEGHCAAPAVVGARCSSDTECASHRCASEQTTAAGLPGAVSPPTSVVGSGRCL